MVGAADAAAMAAAAGAVAAVDVVDAADAGGAVCAEVAADAANAAPRPPTIALSHPLGDELRERPRTRSPRVPRLPAPRPFSPSDSRRGRSPPPAPLLDALRDAHVSWPHLRTLPQDPASFADWVQAHDPHTVALIEALSTVVETMARPDGPCAGGDIRARKDSTLAPGLCAPDAPVPAPCPLSRSDLPFRGARWIVAYATDATTDHEAGVPAGPASSGSPQSAVAHVDTDTLPSLTYALDAYAPAACSSPDAYSPTACSSPDAYPPQALPFPAAASLPRPPTVELRELVPPEARPPPLAPPCTPHAAEDDTHVDRYGFVFGITLAEYWKKVDVTNEHADGADRAPARPPTPPAAPGQAHVAKGTPVQRTAARVAAPAVWAPGTSGAAEAPEAWLPSTSAAAITAASAVASATTPTGAPSRTVPRLLRHAHDTYDEQQRARKERWDAYLAEHRHGRAGASNNACDDAAPSTVWHALFRHLRSLDMDVKADRVGWQQFQRVCQGGIPMEYRPQVWSECLRTSELFEPGLYAELCGGGHADRGAAPTQDACARGAASACTDARSGESHAHTARAGSALDPADRQIRLDVHRTMPNNLFFGGVGAGVPKLQRLLQAYARHDPDTGYCQGMNNIAAILLLTYANEEDAFWALVGMLDTLLPRAFFASDMLVPQADQGVLLGLVRTGLPKLATHMRRLGVELPAVTLSWFLSLFTTCLPTETLFRIWDLLVVDGTITLFRAAYAILSLTCKRLLETQTAGAFFQELRVDAAHLVDADEFVHTCVALRTWIRAEPVAARRQRHLERLSARRNGAVEREAA
ncbi:hypothetical protein MSPP1_001865 [Malassezia sp. CBS 17886]|nr:hypothetical protein MSPP1_001865 [Malassezia sp. CBS 17886]